MPSPTRAAAFRAALTGIPLETVVVRDGDEAKQQILARGAPTLLILDLSLPKLDGFELLRELRQHASPSETGAIVVSGHSAVRAAARRLADPLGISRVLPFDMERPGLREAIDATLNELKTGQVIAMETPPPPARREPGAAVEDVIDTAVMAAVQRFHTAVAVVYVKIGRQEQVRGYFALSGAGDTVSATQSLAFLRQVAAGRDSLIVPNLSNYPALLEVSPGGMPQIEGLAATPLPPDPDISGTICVMDTARLMIDALGLEALEGIAQDLHRDLTTAEKRPVPPGVAGTTVDTDSLERLASADPLTNLANRRGGERDIAAEISRARRQKTPLSCVLLDLDHFKQVNDTFGHQAGDQVLREISALLRRTVRAYDILVRWGGEEFLLVLPGVEHDQALKLAERIRHAIENLPLAVIGGVTVSAGVAPLGTDYSFETMFGAADRRLYSAKAAGRNTVS
jgi:diguanylate cyclase (GGDEF)-like protein